MNQLQSKQKKQDSIKYPLHHIDQSLGFSKAADHPYLQAQGVIGNHGILRRHSTDIIQAKLKIGQPNDKYELEADRLADQVMRMSEPKGSLVNGHSSLVQRKSTCPECMEEGDKVIQTKQTNNQTPTVTSNIESGINSLKISGQPLPESARSFFEPRFGADFSQVRIHTGTQSAELARSINALAFTVGRDIMFGTGQYAPDTNKGQGLLTHELTHVLQQYRKRTPINSIQRKKGAQVTGAAGESPVNKRKYVRESGCDITSVSNLIGNTKVKKAMVEAIESSQWRDNPAVSAITSREIFYLILQNSDCNVEPVFGARGLIGGSYVNPPEVDKGSIDDQTVGRYNNKLVVASFHTHPPVEGYVPGPSPKDRKNMIEFPEVDGNEQYIIDPFFTYVIYRDGSWRTLGTTIKIFGLSKEQTKALRVKPDKRKVSEVAPGLGKLTRCVRDIKKAELMAGLTGERISIIEFSTSWCEPCKYLRSTLDEICDRLYKEKPKNADQLYFYKTDLEVEPSLVKTFLLTDEGVPQLLIFKGSNEVIRIEEFYDDQIYYHDFLLSKILDVLRDEPKAGKRRHLVMLDLGTTDVALTYTYRRIFWAWLNNRLRLGAEFGLGLHFSEFEEKELELSSNTRFRFDSALKLTYDPGDLGKGPFVEGKVGLVAGNKIVPEEEGLRFGLSIGGGVGYSFGRTRVGLYTDFLFTESKQNPLVNKLFVGLGLTFGSSE